MLEFYNAHKKLCKIAGIIIAVIIFAVYLYALFLPGYWFGDVFLYKKNPAIFGELEVYSGHDAIYSADYQMTIIKEGKTAYISFTVNETERFYEITSDNSENHSPAVTIKENDELIFEGRYSGYLRDENGEPFEPLISIGYGPYEPTDEELFPSYNWLYGVSQSLKTEMRGQPIWLILMAVIIGGTIFDMYDPDFFWELRHCLDTKGGEPSDLYRWSQKAGWITAPIMVLFLMILSFAIH